MSDVFERELTDARNTLSADRLDMSFGELMNMYDAGELIIDPEFQRYFRWDISQRTKFIESLLCGIPVPSLFMAEDRNGKWEIVDGLQRVSTILSFFSKLQGEKASENGWKMSPGDIIQSLEGKDLNDLPFKYQLNIKRSSVRIEVIKWDSKYDMRYELFNRLNTGGSPLTDQEVRNCIFRGLSVSLPNEIRELATNPVLVKYVRPTDRQVSELYLDELVLRFYALLWSSAPQTNLGEHLTDYMRKASTDPSLFAGKRELLLRSLAVVDRIGDDKIFMATNSQFSPSRYDGIMMGISKYIEKCESNIDWVRGAVDRLVGDQDFVAASGTASNYKQRVRRRVAKAEELFGNA